MNVSTTLGANVGMQPPMPGFSSEFSISLHDSLTFARLSGDYNPLHVDPIAARRLKFGGTVTHGIHLLLRVLDHLAARKMFDRQGIAAISTTFDSPVLTGTIVNLHASIDGCRVRISAQAATRLAFTSRVELQPVLRAEPKAVDAEFPPAHPQEVDFPPEVTEGTVPLKLSRDLLEALFPSLTTLADTNWIADLLATTRIVGMRCPGMHSIYSSFRLRRAALSESSRASMHYRISGMEKRFHLLRVQITGACLSGAIETFFRPRPVAQRPMKEVASLVSPGAFAGHRALIVGGSRGLGELTAKIVGAGGADVTITYAAGKEDAERICAEMREVGCVCTSHPMDVTIASTQPTPEWLAKSRFTHIYFFASPLISKNLGRWSEGLFRQFTQMYVTAFATLAEQVLTPPGQRDQVVHFLYPSSIFVTHPETGFAEYAIAKAAGEALCDQLQSRCAARFIKPRLPRMRTDQTNALDDVGAVDPLPVMLDVIRNLHS